MTVAMMLTSFVISWSMVPLAQRLGHALGAIDQPNVDVRTHTLPTPLMGGVVIIVGVLIPVILVRQITPPVSLLLAFVILLSLGTYKDVSRRDVSPTLQFLFQLAACALIIASIEWPQWGRPLIVIVAITGVAVINAINFLDVMDGLCSTVTVIVLVGLYVVTGQVFALALAAACAGFWLWNRPKARIFMGDIGSLFIGLCLFYLVTNGVVGGKPVSLIMLTVPIMELVGTISIRLARGKTLLQGDDSHPSLRLLNSGVSPWYVLAIYGSMTLVTFLLSWILHLGWSQ